MRPAIGMHADGEDFVIEGHVGRCWFCDSYPRTRELWYWLENEFGIRKRSGIKILHVAPETSIAALIRKLGADVEYVCIDKHCAGYKYPSYVAYGDICGLSYSDNCFDLIMCNHVLEHVKNDMQAINEIYRVLKKGGTAILMVPIDMSLDISDEENEDETLTPQQREERFGQYDHVRMYGSDYFHRLESVGFSVRRVSYDAATTSAYGFSPGEEVIVCTKI